MNQKIIIAIVAVLFLIGGLYYYQSYNYSAPNPSAGITGTPNSQGSNQVSIKNFAFSPSELVIKKGDTVVWTNNDSAPHTISGSGFQSNDLANGQSYSFTFSTIGTFDYICGVHPSMKGKIIVE